MERIKHDPIESISKTQATKRKRRKYPNVFFKRELTIIFENIEDPKTMIACFLTFFCALRRGEVGKLKWQDIDLENRRLKIVDGKNHKDGFIPISSACIPILRKWKAINHDEEYFLPSENNHTLHTEYSTLLKNFKKALQKAGLNISTEKTSAGRQQHQYKFHTLRHSRCTHLLNNGVPIQKVQHFMRHDDINTTMTYTWILDTELNKMVEEVDQTQKLIYQDQLPENNVMTPTTQIQKNIMHSIIPSTHNDPIEIAKRRLAFGEISPREFKRIIGILQTPMSI